MNWDINNQKCINLQNKWRTKNKHKTTLENFKIVLSFISKKGNLNGKQP